MDKKKNQVTLFCLYKTNMIEDVSVTKNLSIDTTGLEISFVLDQKRKIETTDQPCSLSDFFIAYNNQ